MNTHTKSNVNILRNWMVSLLLMLPLAYITATNHIPQQLITEYAQLTEAEAEAFFPLYFELQERKHELNNEVWNLLKEGRAKGVSEKKYEEILEGVYDTRLSIDRLEKSYFEKFKKVLSFKKIYQVQQAEMRFHREVLKNFGEEKRGGHRPAHGNK